MDHRWGHRASVYLRVEVLANSQPARMGRLRDVSISGAYVSTAAPPSLLARVRITWDSTAGVEPVGLEGYVVRTSSDGFAVEWMEIAPPRMEALTRTLLERLNLDGAEPETAFPQRSEPCAHRELVRLHGPASGARAEQYTGVVPGEPVVCTPSQIDSFGAKRRLA